MNTRRGIITLTCALTSISLAQGNTGDLFGLRNQHADLQSPISASNVKQLQLAWTVDTNDPVSHTPIIHDGKAYFADWGGDVYAVDAQTGKVVWKQTKLENVQKDWPWHGFAGTGAIGDGKLFEASVEGTAFALDAKTGKVLWKSGIAPENEYAGSLATPLYHNGLVYFGLQSVEEPLTAMRKNFKPSFQGKVMALDANTGKLVWQRQLVQNPMNGVPVWTSFALDPELNMLFFTTGNNYTGDPSEHSDSVMAVDATTGELKWAKQVWNQDVWVKATPIGPDYDFGGGAQLFEATLDGQTRKLVGAANKGGFYFVFDRETGEPVWSAAIGYGGVNGGMHGEASIGNGRIYMWGNNSWATGKPPENHPVDIKAVDAATGRYLWSKPTAHPAAASAGYLASNVYFTPSLGGKVRAYNAQNGELLWTSQQHPAIGSALNVVGDSLYFSAGLPRPFGTGKGQAVVAYKLRAGTQSGNTTTTTPASATQTQSQQTQSQQTGQRAETNLVVIRSYAYHPNTLQVPVGTTVTWVNRDTVPHTVTSRNPDGPLDSGTIRTGERYQYTFQQPGRYEYYCTIHPNMKAVVIVGNPTGNTGQNNQQAGSQQSSGQQTSAERHEEAPKIEVNDQAVTNQTVKVHEVVTSEPAWVAIHASTPQGTPGEVLGYTRVEAGETYNINVQLQRQVPSGAKLWVMLHHDTGTTGQYEFGQVQGADQPITQNGNIVTKPFTVKPAGS